MRYNEIILREGFSSLDDFLKEMSENTDKDIVKFLLDNPLFRGMKNDDKFGKKPIPKKRIARDNPQCINKIIDDFLIKNGFSALRSNSIFTTGNYDNASMFGTVTCVFPTKNFEFTWNPKIKDFVFPLEQVESSLVSSITEIFVLDLSKTKKLFPHIKYKFLKKIFVDTLNEIKDEKITNLYHNITVSQAERNFESIYKYLRQIYEKESKESLLNKFSIIRIAELLAERKELCNYIKINENSNVAKMFTNENFREAVKSGNEIMITNKYYYFMNYEFFKANKEKIIKYLLA